MLKTVVNVVLNKVWLIKIEKHIFNKHHKLSPTLKQQSGTCGSQATSSTNKINKAIHFKQQHKPANKV